MNSHQLEDIPLQSPPEPEWPYSTPVSTAYPSAIPRITTDPDQYALGNGSMLAPLASAPYSMQAPSRAQSFDSTPYAGTSTRHSLSMQYHTSGDIMSSQYGLQPPRHGLPLQISQAPTNHYSAAEFPHHWASLPSNSRPLSSTYPFETEVPSSYHSPTVPYMPTSGLPFPAGATDPTPMFPGLSPLASNLPYHGPSRTLPVPASAQSSLHEICDSLQDNEGALDTYSQHLTSRSTVNSAGRDAVHASEGSCSTASSSPNDAHRNSNIEYGNLTYSSHVGSNTSASSLRAGDAPNSGMQPFRSGNSHLPNINSTYSIQDIHGDFSIQDASVNAMASGGLLSNSQTPSGIHHPQPQHSASHDMPPILRGTYQARPREPSRRSNTKATGQKPQRKR